MTLLLLALACAPERSPALIPDATERVALPPPERGVQLSIGPVEYPAYTEAYRCALMPLGNARTLYVTALEHAGSGITHHFNAYLIPIEVEGHQEGDCDDLWDEVGMGLSSPVYGSQVQRFRGEFPEGVAGQMPRGQSVMLEYHGVNPFPEPRIAEAVLNVETADRDEIVEYANGLYGNNANIELAPGERKVISKDCYVDTDMELFVLTSHAHALLETFEVFTLDTLGHLGPRVYYSDDWQSPLMDIRSLEDTIFVPRGGGLQYRCTYHNDTDRTVRYGPESDDEMCQMVGVYFPDDGFKFCRSAPPQED